MALMHCMREIWNYKRSMDFNNSLFGSFIDIRTLCAARPPSSSPPIHGSPCNKHEVFVFIALLIILMEKIGFNVKQFHYYPFNYIVNPSFSGTIPKGQKKLMSYFYIYINLFIANRYLYYDGTYMIN